jgi:hypothetical protein
MSMFRTTRVIPPVFAKTAWSHFLVLQLTGHEGDFLCCVPQHEEGGFLDGEIFGEMASPKSVTCDLPTGERASAKCLRR